MGSMGSSTGRWRWISPRSAPSRVLSLLSAARVVGVMAIGCRSGSARATILSELGGGSVNGPLDADGEANRRQQLCRVDARS